MNPRTAARIAAGAPSLLKRVRQDIVLFDSWYGRHADSPRALSQALQTARPDLRQVWVRKSSNLDAVDSAVSPHSREHFVALERARFIVTNGHLPRYYRTRRATTVVQTWHGTPLKRIGFDLATAQRSDLYRNYLHALARDVARWDVLLSPNRHATRVYRQAFKYDGLILETGAPKNDFLINCTVSDLASLRKRIGVAQDTRILLYAPTFRDASHQEETALVQQMDEVMGLLSPEWTCLLRLHNNARVPSSVVTRPYFIDVTHWDDAQDLLAIADLLVTDYSSVMFDYACTDRPMIFYCPDIDNYRDALRGFYLDFASVAPGPIVRTPRELAEIIRAGPRNADEHAQLYGQFKKQFTGLEDGLSTDRAIASIWGDTLVRR